MRITRPARLADVPTLLNLMEEFQAESNYVLDRAEGATGFTVLLSNPDLGGVWLAERAGEAVGYVVLTVRYAMEYYGCEGYIDDLFVRASARRQGVAQALLAALVADCRQRGVKALVVEVGRGNHTAASFGLRGWEDDREVLVCTLI
jgi:GNAT superfamily N-acetyltransferase